MRASPAHGRRQRGVTLVEGLIAFVVLALGMVAIGRAQSQLRLGSDIARQRSEAVRLGQQDIEGLRAFASIGAASAGLRSYAQIASAAATIDGNSGYTSNTAYALVRDVGIDASTGAKTASVTVGWSDRTGADQHIVLNTIIGGIDPAYSAAFGRAPTGAAVKGAYGRSAFIPPSATNLGNGRSALKPVSGGTVAYVFDNLSGSIVARCTGLDPATATATLAVGDLVACDAHVGYLLSGIVRFSLGAPPDASAANDLPLGLSIAVTGTGGTYAVAPTCASEALKGVSYTSASIPHTAAVPLAATPASLGFASWSASGERFVAWHCVVYPLANGEWSGRATVVPSGWSIGITGADLRVCRYAADLDGSGAVDSNIEHPASYSGVRGALANQNFLVIGGSQSCPTASPVNVVGAAGDVYADLTTVQHQP